MKREVVRAHAGHLVANAFSLDVVRALDIIKTFTVDSDNHYLLSGVILVLAKFSEECIHDDPDFVDRTNKWFNELLRQEKVR